jgi:phage baseplate assembly protein W
MKSIKTPFSVEDGSTATTRTFDTAIKQKITDVLVTSYNERPVKPSYGGNLWANLFDTFGELEQADYKVDLISAISRNVSSVSIRDVLFDTSEPGVVIVTILYSTPLSAVVRLTLNLPTPFNEESALTDGI